MVKIAFHDNQLCERGTTVSLFDYAYYNVKILGNESIIMYYGSDHRNVPAVIEKFDKHFKLCPYENWNRDADEILKREKCDILYMQKAGEWDGKISHYCKNIVHCVFNTQYKHGDVYGRISGCFGQNYPIVNYMVNLPNIDTHMREELNIPSDAIVFGRHGGLDQFNINYVHSVIDKITDEDKKIYFLFVNTNKFCKEKSNIIHYDKIIDLEKKVEFINTCDAMIHARQMGETFGAAISEFSIKNKPVITCRGHDNTHLDILSNNCFVYNDYNSLYEIFNTITNNIGNIKHKDWNQYKLYSPENIINDFNEKFIKPCLYDKNININTLSFKEHNLQYNDIDALKNEIFVHNEKTNSVKNKDGSKWDNLYKPGHLHGEWLDNNKILYDKFINHNLLIDNYFIKCGVDIGCGTGWFVNYLETYYKFENIYGIEPSESAINIGKNIYKESKVNYLIGFAEEQLKNIKLTEPTLFTTFIVLSHIPDDSVIKILKEMDKIAPSKSVFIFNENFDNTFHQNLWHCRTREWWKQQLPSWNITFDVRPRPDLQFYKQGLKGIKK